MLGVLHRRKGSLDNSAAKQVMQRSGVGRIRHLSCRILWIQQLVKSKELETASIPTKENYADLGTKKLTRERMRYLMHGLGVFDEDSGELVGADVVFREQAADDFKGVLRMLRESVGESATHATVKSAKKSLQTLLLMSLVSSSDALSLPSPMSAEWFSVEFPNFSSWMVCLVILFCIWFSALVMVVVRPQLVVVPQQRLLADEPEPESQLNKETSASRRSFNTIAVYGFLALCVKRCLELLSDAEFGNVLL